MRGEIQRGEEKRIRMRLQKTGGKKTILKKRGNVGKKRVTLKGQAFAREETTKNRKRRNQSQRNQALEEKNKGKMKKKEEGEIKTTKGRRHSELKKEKETRPFTKGEGKKRRTTINHQKKTKTKIRP